MAQITQLQPTNTLGTDDQAILRQGTIDKRISLELASTLSWAKRNGYSHIGSHSVGSQFPDMSSFTTYEGQIFFVEKGVSLPYTSPENNPINDDNLYLRTDLDKYQDYGNVASGVQVIHRQGTNAEIMAGVPAIAELWFNTTDNSIHMGDGTTTGGIKHAKISSVKLSSDTIDDAKARIDLSEGYIIDVSETLQGNGGGAVWRVVLSSSVTTNNMDIVQCTGLTQYALVALSVTSVRVLGWTDSGGESNYNIMAHYIKSGYATNQFSTLYNLTSFMKEAAAGNVLPLAFYGDSTTDGATTTGHVSSYIDGSVNDFTSPIVITHSPNSYCSKLQEWLRNEHHLSGATIFNAGFDSMSLKQDFGNKGFHRVFFGHPTYNNVDYSSVKGIVIAWGTSDSINFDNPQEVLDSYEWKMELLINECFERKIQPFIMHPVLNTQLNQQSESGRNNYESITLIESINNKLVQKYNLEILSLRTPLEQYAVNCRLQNGDVNEVLATDGVHPNDKGHRQVAGYLMSKMWEGVKTISDPYKLYPSNPYIIHPLAWKDDNCYSGVDQDALTTRASKFWRFTEISDPAMQCYWVNVYCEKPMDLVYESFDSSSVTEIDTDKLPIITTYKRTDNDAAGSQIQPLSDVRWSNLTSGGHEMVTRLQVGLNKIFVNSPNTVPTGNWSPGILRIVEADYGISDTAEGGNRADIIPFNGVLHNISSVSVPLWMNRDFDREAYYSCPDSVMFVTFEASRLQDLSVMWGGNRLKTEYDTFNKMRCNGTDVQLFTVKNGVEKLIGAFTSSYDFSTVGDGMYNIYISTNQFLQQVVYLQKYDATTGIFDNLGSITITPNGDDDIFYTSGYSFGIQKETSSAIHYWVRDAVVRTYV